MPRKIRELIQDLLKAGFYEIPGGGKGSHRKFAHDKYSGAVTLSGQSGDDAKAYQENRSNKQLKRSEMKEIDRFHKWVEWSEEDQVYLGKCPDLVTGIHGDDPIQLYAELCEVVEEVIQHFKSVGRALPQPSVRPMREIA